MLFRSFAKLQAYAKRESPGADVECTADLRYQGQSYELNVAWNPHDPFAAFHREHQKLYGYATPECAVEIVTVRVRARRRFPKPRLVREKRQAARVETRPVWVNSAWMELRVVPRTSIGERASIGPAVVLDYGSTTLVPEGWSYRVDRVGNLLMTNAR